MKNLKIEKVKIFASKFLTKHMPVIIGSKFSTQYRYLSYIYVDNDLALSYFEDLKNENEIKSVTKIFSKSNFFPLNAK